MDTEAIQLLNLSPIPEISEAELGTMLEQLSCISELQNDITDRNVEDILKEAEELIDKSSCSKYSELDMTNSHDSDHAVKSANNRIKNSSESDGFQMIQKESESDTKPRDSNIGVHLDLLTSNDGSPKTPDSLMKCQNSPVVPDKPSSSESDYSLGKQYSQHIFAPGHSTNHIKCTIDSLKEFSNLVEKQLMSPKKMATTTKVDRNFQRPNNELTLLDNCPSDRSKSSTLSSLDNPVKISHTNGDNRKENASKPSKEGKFNKPLNCFERLYQDRPSRFSGANKKPKCVEKVSKVVTKKKKAPSLKTYGYSNSGSKYKTLGKFSLPDEISASNNKYKLDENGIEDSSRKHNRPSVDVEKPAEDSHATSDKHNYMGSQDNLDLDFSLKSSRILPLGMSPHGSAMKLNYTKFEETLILKLLQEMKEIKNQIKSSGVVSENAGNEWKPLTSKTSQESIKCESIKRLEEQFAALKNKYSQQMEKLEMQNAKLKEALNVQQKGSISQMNINRDNPSVNDVGLQTESSCSGVSVSNSQASCTKIYRSTSLETVGHGSRDPQGSPKKSEDLLQDPSENKDAFSQTEADVRNISIQCEKSVSGDSMDPEGEDNGLKKQPTSNSTKFENKENVADSKKRFRSKPFTDTNSYGVGVKGRKATSEHEIQLLATLRGLQAENLSKDKENRKLKVEIDVLKTQVRKLSKNKIEGVKRSHIGCQTIALGPITQRPYNPEVYEACEEAERENEELKARIKCLEESIELLKEKRVNDLQSLHQVHEKEMAKLVSKLESQSALTKHLHSLLVNR